jgi:hypothetical protein
MKMAPMKEYAWCLPPYVGVLLATAVVHMTDWQAASSRALIWLIGLLLVAPVGCVLIAVEFDKIDRAKGFLWGLLGLGIIFLVVNLILGIILALLSRN